MIFTLQEKAKVLPRSRACVGAEVLLGSECPPVNLVEQAESTALSLDLEQELKHFFFDEQAALITRSQVEGKDMTLPKRFIQVHPKWLSQTLFPAACLCRCCVWSQTKEYGGRPKKVDDGHLYMAASIQLGISQSQAGCTVVMKCIQFLS